eukprot:UN03937
MSGYPSHQHHPLSGHTSPQQHISSMLPTHTDFSLTPPAVIVGVDDLMMTKQQQHHLGAAHDGQQQPPQPTQQTFYGMSALASIAGPQSPNNDTQ